MYFSSEGHCLFMSMYVAISTNQKPTIYRNLYENTSPVLETVQRHGVYSTVYGTVHYKEHLKWFEIRVGHSPRFGFPFCRDIAMIVQKAT